MGDRPGSVTIVAGFLFLLGLYLVFQALIGFGFISMFFGGLGGGLASSAGHQEAASALSAFGMFFGGLLAGILIVFAIIYFAIGFLLLKGNRIARWIAVLVGVFELRQFSLPFPMHSIIGIIFLYVLLGDQKSKDFFAK
ncbi:MAG: hypothetical protein NT067_00985 [Candidatus Diapherotrites archaeon]|nr:hypothetical protein [Candidatus Diapherotrites archaeon]